MGTHKMGVVLIFAVELLGGDSKKGFTLLGSETHLDREKELALS